MRMNHAMTDLPGQSCRVRVLIPRPGPHVVCAPPPLLSRSLRTGPRPVTITTTADDGARPTSPCPPALACADVGIPHRARHVHLPISVATAELGGGSRGGGATAGVVGEGWGQRAQGWIGGAAR